MRHAKYFSITVFIFALAYGALGYYFLPYANFNTELPRLGLLPESQFGWRKPQPAIDSKWLAQASMQEADVLVIGDSFSDSRVWQTVLTQRGYKVRTVHWDYMRGICNDFTSWLNSQGFHGKFVVLEIIERHIEDGLDKSVACANTQIHPNILIDAPRTAPAVSAIRDAQLRSGRFSIGIKTYLNYQNYVRYSSAPDFKSAALPNGTKVVRIKNGCELFSHTRCNDSLFLAEDKAEDLNPITLDVIETLNARISGITAIWAFVPNKSTTYLYPDKQFWNNAEKRYRAPNLLRMAQKALQEKTVDLYPADNTHFSTTGYLLMGEEIFKAIQAAQAQKASR